jgi:hypothetical protein
MPRFAGDAEESTFLKARANAEDMFEAVLVSTVAGTLGSDVIFCTRESVKVARTCCPSTVTDMFDAEAGAHTNDRRNTVKTNIARGRNDLHCPSQLSI